MKKIFFVLIIMCSLYAIKIPQSSLEVVKHHIIIKLTAAQKQKNQKLIAKYQAELNNIEKKIKKFELEWLEYRKAQLKAKPTNAASSGEIKEIDELIKERS